MPSYRPLASAAVLSFCVSLRKGNPWTQPTAIRLGLPGVSGAIAPQCHPECLFVTGDTPDQAVTVVGAGIVGICTALSLIERGAKVRLIDRAAPGQGASFGNAGIISPCAVVPQSMPGQWKRIPGWLLDPQGPIHLPLQYMPQFMPWGLRFLLAGREARVREVSEAMALLNKANIALYQQLLVGTGHEDLICDSYYIHTYRDPSKARTDDLEWDLRRAQGA